ncbi:MAG: EmrB/QacA subfamily drug resistance transporter [Candidatus Poriferisodalaceae bacterium]
MTSTEISPRQFRLLIAGLIVGLFLSSTEQSVVATALPTMAGELGGADRLSWVVSAYLLTSTIVTPIYGKLSDLLGRRPVYQMSITIFIVGTLLCGVAQTMNQLIAARAVQGLGGGGLMSLAFIILGDVVSPRDRGRYIGLFTTVFTVSAVIGPLWGGALVDNAGWRWVFLAIVPVGLVALVVTGKALRIPFGTRDAKIDWLGGALLTVATTGLILMLIWGAEDVGWTSPQVLIAGFAGIGGAVLFVRQERRASEPVVPLRLFSDRTVASVFVMGFLLMFGLIASTTFLPLLLQIGTGASATKSGLMMIPQSVGISASAALMGYLVSSTGRYKWTLILGPVLSAIGMALVSTIGVDVTMLSLTPILLLLGIGLGMTFPHLTLAVQNAAEPADLGVATSGANFFRALGGVFGAAIGGVVMATRLETRLSDRLDASRLDDLGGASGLIRSPKAVQELAPDLQDIVADSVAGAVSGVFLLAVPVMAAIALIGLLIEERPLRTHSAMSAPAKTGADD